MPHSSGGGSHSGGSHSGGGGSSHHSSSGGGSSSSSTFSNTRLSTKPYRFCTTYCYYKDKKPVYVYSTSDAKTSKPSGFEIFQRILCFVLVAPMFFVLAFWMFMEGINTKDKLKGSYDKEIIIEDNAGVIDDEDELYDVLEDFYKKTGIVPGVLTINNEEWINDNKDFPKVALKKYTSIYDDEAHWLIVYSEPKNPDPEFNDWYWEGIQGDRTDKIVTRKVADTFTEEVHKLLLKNSVSVDEAIAGGFKKITPGIMKAEVKWGAVFFAILVLGFLVWLAVYLFDIHPIRKAILKKSFKVPVNDYKNIKEETCEFCGGIYVIGCHLDCPHCGGAIKPHDYTVDAQGNVKEVLS